MIARHLRDSEPSTLDHQLAENRLGHFSTVPAFKQDILQDYQDPPILPDHESITKKMDIESSLKRLPSSTSKPNKIQNYSIVSWKPN